MERSLHNCLKKFALRRLVEKREHIPLDLTADARSTCGYQHTLYSPTMEETDNAKQLPKSS
jgi:hypothetical protein